MRNQHISILFCWSFAYFHGLPPNVVTLSSQPVAFSPHPPHSVAVTISNYFYCRYQLIGNGCMEAKEDKILYINGISRKGYTHNPQPIKIIYFITLCSFSYSASSACIEFLLCCFLVSGWAVNDVKPYDVVDDTPFNLFTFMCGRKIYIVYNRVAVGAREAIAHRRRPSFHANAILRLIHIPTSRLMRTKNRILCKQKWIKWKMLKCWW